MHKNLESLKENWAVCKEFAKDGVSLLAIDTSNGNKVLGISFNKIHCAPSTGVDQSGFAELRKTFKTTESKKLFEYIEDIDSKFDAFEHFKVDSIIEFMYFGVLDEYQGRGIGYKMVEEFVKMGKQLKDGNGVERLPDNLKNMRPGLLLSTFSSRYGQSIAKKLGFKLLHEEFYKDIKFPGMDFADAAHPSYQLVAMEL